ncbi:MAG: hypothetical protein ACLFTQ_02305 [Candidatus Aenigmatarchaeota archaeon]
MTGKTPVKKVSAKKTKKEVKTFSEEVAPKLDPKARNMCLKCRGAKNLCGKDECPVLLKYYSQVGEKKGKKFDTDEIEGHSPPSVFVGRHNYPKVNVGPMVPPEKGDTSIYSRPEKWYGKKNLSEIVELRGSLARGKRKLQKDVSVQNLRRETEEVRYLALAKRPAEAEVKFEKKLSEGLKFDGRSQPHGPSAPMESFRRGSMSSHRQLEKVFYDKDLKAKDAVKKLYGKGISVSRIQDIFAVGGTGIGKDRKFVPTRWSITAVDDILGKDLRRTVKTYPLMDGWRVYTANYLDNQWVVVLTPESWRYEMIEAFYPETTWNPSSDSITIFGDHEEFDGRDDYASIGGCYYSGRLAALEKLDEERRQAGVIILREAKPGYILPVGVWNVRESVRNALKTQPRKFESREKTFKHLKEILDLDFGQWLSVSRLLKKRQKQENLLSFT